MSIAAEVAGLWRRDGLLAYAAAVRVFSTGMRLTACFRSSGSTGIAAAAACLLRRVGLLAYVAAVWVFPRKRCFAEMRLLMSVCLCGSSAETATVAALC